MEYRVVAILATDVIGYSRLMELDELCKLDSAKALREELIDLVILPLPDQPQDAR